MIYRGLKRSIDVVLASVGLVILAVPMALIALGVLSTHGRPVFYRQTRPGLGGRPFRIFKFRTMLDREDVAGEQLDDSERLTPFGLFLRRTSLDELPELWNVVRGDMSLIGPRPLLMEYLPLYTPRQARRHDVRPGITGWAQVNGRNALSWDEKFELDVWYVEHASLALDVRVLLRTVWTVLRREGITQADHATAARFLGSANDVEK